MYMYRPTVVKSDSERLVCRSHSSFGCSDAITLWLQYLHVMIHNGGLTCTHWHSGILAQHCVYPMLITTARIIIGLLLPRDSKLTSSGVLYFVSTRTRNLRFHWGSFVNPNHHGLRRYPHFHPPIRWTVSYYVCKGMTFQETSSQVR